MSERHEIIQGDCIQGLAKMPEASVDLVFADPPFNIGYKYDVYEDRKSAAEYLDWSKQWAEGVQRVLKPNGTFWLAIGDDFAAELKTLFQRDLGFCCRSWVIWYYTFGVNCTRKFSRSHTHLFHFVKNPKSFKFNAAAIKVPSARQLVYADDRANEDGRLPDDTWILRPHDVPNGFTPDQDTWFFSRVCGTFNERAGFHSCQMPEQLLARIIRVSSDPGDLVVDPFAGSGSTLIVAKKLGRNCVGFEMSGSYAKKARKRLAKATEGALLEGPENPLASAPRTANGRKLDDRIAQAAASVAIVDKRSADQAILEAFIVAREDCPVDRVIADPELNQKFVTVCGRWGVPGTAYDWNRRLLNLRKTGRLSDLPRSKRTKFTVEDEMVDGCDFACEIAMQHFDRQGHSLDDVLCDPIRAAEFDRLVRWIVGKELSPLLIRWVALGIRKRAKNFQRKAERIGAEGRRLPAQRTLAQQIDLEKLPAAPGLYWLQNVARDSNLYIGKTRNLQRRLQTHIVVSEFDFWGAAPKNLLAVRFRPHVLDTLEAHQSYWILRCKPESNYRLQRTTA